MSKNDVLLVYPQYSYPKKSPPLGLAYLAAVLEQKGYSVRIADMSAIGLNCIDIQKQVLEDKPRLVGISFMTNQFQNALNVAKAVKQADKNIPVITGGPHVSALPQEILANDIG